MPQDREPNQSNRHWFSYTRLGLLGVMAIASITISLTHRNSLVSAQNESAQDEPEAIEFDGVMPVNRELVTRISQTERPNATVHAVQVKPFSNLSIAIADDLTTVRAFAEKLKREGNPAIAILNGGFFDPNNGKTTSHIVINGQIAGDPSDNEGLTGNPNMQPYLPQIFNRSEFRVYECPLVGMVTPYDITAHEEPAPDGCEIVYAIGAGPQLLPADTSEAEAFTQYENGTLTRDAIGSVSPNARSAIGIHEDGSAVLLMVAQRPDAPGFTLAEVADYAASIGIVKLLNLDGGSSSSLYYGGELHLGKLSGDEEAIERPVKSVIVVE